MCCRLRVRSLTLCYKFQRPEETLTPLHCPAPGHQVDDENDYGHDQKQMNQASGNMKTPSQQPQHQQNGKNCPKHGLSPQSQKTGVRTRNHNATLELYDALLASVMHCPPLCLRFLSVPLERRKRDIDPLRRRPLLQVSQPMLFPTATASFRPVPAPIGPS